MSTAGLARGPDTTSNVGSAYPHPFRPLAHQFSRALINVQPRLKATVSCNNLLQDANSSC